MKNFNINLFIAMNYYWFFNGSNSDILTQNCWFFNESNFHALRHDDRNNDKNHYYASRLIDFDYWYRSKLSDKNSIILLKEWNGSIKKYIKKHEKYTGGER